MGQITINRAANANLYMNGASFLGQVEEIQVPDIPIKTVDHKALGMVGTLEFFSGIDKMEGSVKWNSMYAQARITALNYTTMNDIQVRSSVDGYDGTGRKTQVPLVIYLKVMFKNVPGGMWRQHENVDVTSKFNAFYYKENLNGQDIVEIDVLNNIYKVNGVDLLATYRNNIGQ